MTWLISVLGVNSIIPVITFLEERFSKMEEVYIEVFLTGKSKVGLQGDTGMDSTTAHPPS